MGIRQAKNNLSKLIDAVRNGEEVILTNRGEHVVKLVPAPKVFAPGSGRGLWKDKINFYPGWDSLEEDKKLKRCSNISHKPDTD